MRSILAFDMRIGRLNEVRNQMLSPPQCNARADTLSISLKLTIMIKVARVNFPYSKGYSIFSSIIILPTHHRLIQILNFLGEVVSWRKPQF